MPCGGVEEDDEHELRRSRPFLAAKSAKKRSALSVRNRLDQRIEEYTGKRPIGFYRWDLDCLEDVTAQALDEADVYPEKSGRAYEAMENLHKRIKRLRAQAYGEIG